MTSLSPQQRLIDALPPHLRAQAAERYARHGVLLADRLTRLYGHLDGFAQWHGDLAGLAGAGRSPLR